MWLLISVPSFLGVLIGHPFFVRYLFLIFLPIHVWTCSSYPNYPSKNSPPHAARNLSRKPLEVRFEL